MRKARRGFVFGLGVLVCALACARPAAAQLDQWGFWENGVTEHWWLSSEDFEKADALGAIARWQSIGEAAAGEAAAGEPWAGDYFRGDDTYGTYVRWSPRAGFVVAHVNKCEARVMGLVYGRVEVTPTFVRLIPELDKVHARGHGGGEHNDDPAAKSAAKLDEKSRAKRDEIRFVPVEWRGERMLVAEREMGEFGDYVAGLGRYNQPGTFRSLDYALFLSRMNHRAATAANDDEEADDDNADDGDNAPPVVPHGYERFLKRPVEAAVTSVGRRVLKRDYTLSGGDTYETFARASLTYVTIDAGAEQGVRAGMLFRVASPDEGDTVLVVRAGPHASTAAVVRDVDERGAEVYFDSRSRELRHTKVAAGWRLTTSHRD